MHAPEPGSTESGAPGTGTGRIGGNISSYEVEIRITPRQGILDPEGETIGRALADLGYDGVSEVHAGRLIRMRIEAADADAARERAAEMCERLIANPVIEDYDIR